MRGRRKKLKFKLISFCFTLIVCVVVHEFLLRTFEKMRVKKNGASMVRSSDNEDIVFELIPGLKKIDGINYSINSDGFRWSEFNANKKESDFRIIVVGDSIAMGFGVEIKDSFSYRLGEILKDKNSSKLNYEVINTGTFYFDIKKELTLLKSKLLLMKPDLIVLAISGDDSNIMTKVLTGDKAIKHHFNVSYFQPLYNNSLLWRKIYDVLYVLKASFESSYDKNLEYVVKGKDFDLYSSYFKEFSSVLNSNNIKLGIIIFPSTSQLKADLKKSQPNIENLIENLGHKSLDLIGVYRKYDVDEIYLEGEQVHPNTKGHDLTASAIYSYLVGNNLLN